MARRRENRRAFRFLPLAAIVAAVLLVIAVLTSSGSPNRPGHLAATAADSARHRGSAGGATARPVVPAAPRVKLHGPHADPVPILMYHVTKTPPAGTPYPELWVKPADFKGQMNWLARQGYTAITMRRLFDYWDAGYALPKRPVVISFDDGYPSHDRVARPILAGHHWPGVLFLELNNVNSPDTGFTASMVRDLAASGWEIDSHTISHPDLTTVDAVRLRRELTVSRERIKREFGQPADFFCYPAGRYDAAVVAAVKSAGYRGATTTLEGVGERAAPYELKRVRIDGSDGVAGFAAKMRQTGR